MPYTTHGHWYGPGEPTQPGPRLVAKCGGPGICYDCGMQAGLKQRPGDQPLPNPGDIPGWEGSQGPFAGQYGKPHVYARDVHSGAGNCVCGGGLGDSRHVQAAPGVPVPDRMRRATR